MKWRNKNLGKHPDDPDYIQDYDPEEDHERFLEEQEQRFESERGN